MTTENDQSRDPPASRGYAIRLYISLNKTGHKARWVPLIKDVLLPAVPRIGESVCIFEDSYGTGVPVQNVEFMLNGRIVVHLEGDEYVDGGKDAAVEAAFVEAAFVEAAFVEEVKYYESLGFIQELP
jgi:hypothetical protein